MFNIVGIYDLVSQSYKHIFLSTEVVEDIVRGFIGAQYGKNDVAFFYNDFTLNLIGTIDSDGHVATCYADDALKKPVVLITGTEAHRQALSNDSLKAAFGDLDSNLETEKEE